MASYCKQCSLELFGFDPGDLVWTPEQPTNVLVALCEGCGYCLVQPDGTCVKHELAAHGRPAEIEESPHG